jgi:hypothetical protein
VGIDGVSGETVIDWSVAAVLKVAVTFCACVIVTLQVLTPLQAGVPPLQPTKAEPFAAVAVSVTGVPEL